MRSGQPRGYPINNIWRKIMTIKTLLKNWENQLLSDMDLQPAIDEMGTRKLLDGLLDNVGNLNSLVRENVLVAFWTLVWDKPALSSEECIYALNTSLGDDFLFRNIGEDEGDAAFCRAFASPFIMWIINADGRQNFLSNDQYMEALEKSIDYMKREKDRRGFVYGKGTVHTIPHGSGLIWALIEHPKFPMEYVSTVLDMVKCCVLEKGRFAGADWADFGVATIITHLLDRGVDEGIVMNWIETLMPLVEATIYTDEHYKYVQMGSNIELFLMYLYFELKQKDIYGDLQERITQHMPKLRQKVYR